MAAYDCVAFAFSCASSFLRAAKIISSLRLCRFACLSVLSALHDFAFGCSSCAGCSGRLSLEDRLYRVIKSGCVGLAGVAAARAGVGAVRGAGVGIWKDAGAYESISLSSLPANPSLTYSIQTPPTQAPLDRRRNIPSVPLEIPCDVSSTQLRKHFGHLVYLCRVYTG
jgi:hypothetical protein